MTKSPFRFHYCKLAVISSVLLAGCAQSPTGRDQILMFSTNEMSQLGSQSFEQLKQQERISTDKAVNQYVQCVANSITNIVGTRPGFEQWEVVVFDSEQVNAFALPGGKIGVYTGLLNVTKTEDQLASVIGHEIGHVLANHSNERLSRSQLAGLGLQVASVAVQGSGYGEYHDLTMAGLGLGVQYGVLMPYGRSQESESDIIGVQLMNQAGYDPNASIELWKNMAKISGEQPPEFLSTHPSHNTRIGELSEEINRLPSNQVSKPNCKRP
ncbi:M48 family metallopeptidase [Thaumasiovibrio sp. DFM-14]|uniref:M48 family metallopeptidase n=1 Tax=Thaumasiovibrio sp. DFM-14 TaxID=3384792 RepID=UPI0039A04FD4